jgi:hypothetical protein
VILFGVTGNGIAGNMSLFPLYQYLPGLFKFHKEYDPVLEKLSDQEVADI